VGFHLSGPCPRWPLFRFRGHREGEAEEWELFHGGAMSEEMKVDKGNSPRLPNSRPSSGTYDIGHGQLLQHK
jgi:hypothetical protein